MDGLDAEQVMKDSGLEKVLVSIGRRGVVYFFLLIVLCALLRRGAKAQPDDSDKNTGDARQIYANNFEQIKTTIIVRQA